MLFFLKYALQTFFIKDTRPKQSSNFVHFGKTSAKWQQKTGGFWYFTVENGQNLKSFCLGQLIDCLL